MKLQDPAWAARVLSEGTDMPCIAGPGAKPMPSPGSKNVFKVAGEMHQELRALALHHATLTSPKQFNILPAQHGLIGTLVVLYHLPKLVHTRVPSTAKRPQVVQ